MKNKLYVLSLLLLPLIAYAAGCEKKDQAEQEHFGSSPIDGEDTDETQEEHFGPSPIDS